MRCYAIPLYCTLGLDESGGKDEGSSLVGGTRARSVSVPELCDAGVKFGEGRWGCG